MRLVLVVALALAGCTSPPAPQGSPAVRPLAECLAISTFADEIACALPHMDDAIARENASGFLLELERAQARGAIDDCHMLAHHLGHEAYDTLDDLERALALGSPRCIKGYYHGVMESALAARARQGNASIVGLCDSLLGKAEPWDGCVHGLGHGVMWRDEDDLLQALADCGTLTGERERARCEDGALMENSLRYAELADDEYERVAPYACAGIALNETRMATCYDEVGAVALLHYRHDLTRALRLCGTIDWDAAARAQCEAGARSEQARDDEVTRDLQAAA